jgi:AP-1 complex subunit gamma-1
MMEVSKLNPADPSSTTITCKFNNLSTMPLEGLTFQAAVPKYLKLEMAPASSSSIPPKSNGVVTQEVKLVNSMQGQKPIMLKIKVGYSQAGIPVEEMAQVSSFPPTY